MTFRTFRKIFALPSIATSAKGREAEVGPDPEYRSRLRQDSAFFLRTRTRSQKIKKKRTRIRSHFSISAIVGVCVVIS